MAIRKVPAGVDPDQFVARVMRDVDVEGGVAYRGVGARSRRLIFKAAARMPDDYVVQVRPYARADGPMVHELHAYRRGNPRATGGFLEGAALSMPNQGLVPAELQRAGSDGPIGSSEAKFGPREGA